MEGELDQIVAVIRKHLSDFPNAADTVDGIAAWWLALEHPGISHAQVELALQRLVDAGFARARRMENGTVIYALNKAAG